MTEDITGFDVVSEKPIPLWPPSQPGRHGGALDGRFFRKVQHVIAGHRDKGKGLSTIRVGADVIKAGGNVLHLAYEDLPGLMTRPRYEAAGVRGEALKRLHLKKFKFPSQMAEFKAYMLEKKIDLVVLDPVASALDNPNARHSDAIRGVCEPIQDFIAEAPTKPGVIWVEHPNKSVKKGSDPLSAIGGTSSGLVAFCRVAYILGVDPDTDGDRILAHVKGNFMERPPAMRFELDLSDILVRTLNDETGEIEEEELPYPALMFSEECIFDPIRLLVKDKDEDSHLGRPNDKQQAASEWLTDYLFNAYTNGLPATADFDQVEAGQGVPSARVFEDAKLVRIAERTLRRAKQEMGVEVRDAKGKVAKGGRSARWCLPDEILELLAVGDDVPADTAQDAPEAPESDDDFEAELAGLLASSEGVEDEAAEEADDDGE